MEAKDTVLTKEERNQLWLDIWDMEENLPSDLVTFSKEYEKRQTEKSFKAGIREVMEWIKEEAGLSPNTIQELSEGYAFIPMRRDRYEAKLKEWGIK